MRMNLYLVNASFEFPLGWDSGNLPETADAANIANDVRAMGVSKLLYNRPENRAERNESAYRQSTSPVITLTGDCLNWNVHGTMRNAERKLCYGDKSQS